MKEFHRALDSAPARRRLSLDQRPGQPADFAVDEWLFTLTDEEARWLHQALTDMLGIGKSGDEEALPPWA